MREKPLNSRMLIFTKTSLCLAVIALAASCTDQPIPTDHDAGKIVHLNHIDSGPHDSGPTYTPVPHDAGRPVTIESVTPPTGPVQGGVRVRGRGQGFAPDSAVIVNGVDATDTFVTNNRIITFRLPPSHVGPAEIIVHNSLGTATSNEFEYIDEHAPQSHPSRGSIGGGTYVTIFKEGIGDENATVLFGGAMATVVDSPDDNTLNVRTPPGIRGFADINIDSNGIQATMSGAFEYYDPAFITGGVHGGIVDGAFNVKVLTIVQGQPTPIPDAAVWLGVDQEPSYARSTDLNGLATLSGPDVYGPQTVTIAVKYCITETYIEVPAEDLTVYLTCSFPSPPASGAPPPQPPVVFPRIMGTVTGFSKALFDPATLGPFERAFGFVDLTQRNMFSSKTPKATTWEQPVPQGGRPCTWFSTGNCVTVFGNDTIFQDNATFDFITLPGRYAIVVFTGVINIRTQEIRDVRQMGITRGINAVFGETVSDVVVNLEYDLQRSTLITLPNAPFYSDGRDGPTHSKVASFLDFGGEGVYHLSTQTSVRSHLHIESLPSIAGQQLSFYAGTFTREWDPNTDNLVPCRMHTDCQPGQSCRTGSRGESCHGSYIYNEPYSAIIRSSQGELHSGTELGEMAQFPEMISPRPGEYLSNRLFRWRNTTQTTSPSLYLFSMADMSTGNNWKVYVPGHLTKFRLPYFPETGFEGLVDMPSSGAYAYRMISALMPGFNYSQWDSNEISSYNRRAWTQEVSMFTLDN